MTTLLVLGLVALLLGNGNSNSQSSVTQVSAEPLLFPDASGSPAVRISWTPNGFAKGNAQKALWQIWRDDILGSPVLVVPGIQGNAIDTTAARAVSYADFGRVVGGTTCDNEDSTDTDVTAVAGVVPGRPYLYRVELVYGLSSIDLPDGGTGGSGTGGGTTGGGNTGGGNTGGGNTGGGNTGGGNTGGGNTGGGNTGGGGGGSAATCYFLSDQTVAQGVATPLDRVQLNTPASNATVSAPINFTFNSVANPIFPTNMEYVVQFSTQPTFPQAQTYTVTSFVSNATGILSTPTIDTLGPNIPANIRNAQEVYWRIGARNVNDRPGPVPDASGQRYVFGAGRKFTRPAPPPNPPL